MTATFVCLEIGIYKAEKMSVITFNVWSRLYLSKIWIENEHASINHFKQILANYGDKSLVWNGSKCEIRYNLINEPKNIFYQLIEK